MPLTVVLKVSKNQCVLCPSGSYCPAGFASNFNNTCPKGYYCIAGTQNPFQYPCPAGTYQSLTGQSDASACISCILGNYCPSGSIVPTQCPSGTYNPNNSSAILQNCLPCPLGKSCPSLGTVTPNTCLEGYYCPQGFLLISHSFIIPGTIFFTSNPCPAGTFGSSNNLTRVDDCSICPAGFSCASGSNLINQQPIACSVGHYCPSGTAYATEYPCPGGTYNPFTNATKSTDCIICPPGSYCAVAASVPTGACASGYYCPAGSLSAQVFIFYSKFN